MRILIVKTSSMGDVIHTLPAVSDIRANLPAARIDWLVEEGFAEIPHWHPAVDRVIPCAVRRWRKTPWRTWRSGEWREFRETLNAARYDAVIDAQGLLKSAWLARLVKTGERHGLDRNSIREPLASRFYQRVHPVSWEQHAVMRVRQLCANSLGYSLDSGSLDYGIDPHRLAATDSLEAAFAARGIAPETPYLVFLHGTTWPTKHYPEPYWKTLVAEANRAGFAVALCWGNEVEKARAERLAEGRDQAAVMPRLALAEVATLLSRAAGAIAVDTGLGHLAASLNCPTVSLYSPTDPRKVGAFGHHQVYLSTDYPLPEGANSLSRSGFPAPAEAAVEPANFAGLLPETVWDTCQALLSRVKATSGQSM